MSKDETFMENLRLGPETLTEKHLGVLRHTLGLNEKTGSGKQNRNYFNDMIGGGPIIKDLVRMKLMAPMQRSDVMPNSQNFYVTKEGMKEARVSCDPSEAPWTIDTLIRRRGNVTWEVVVIVSRSEEAIQLVAEFGNIHEPRSWANAYRVLDSLNPEEKPRD